MDIKTLALAAFVAAAYTAWPNLSKALRISGGLVAVIVVAVALVVVLLISHRDLAQVAAIPIGSHIWVIAFAIANGLAIYVYANKAADPSVSTGMLLATVFILQMFFAPLADWFVNGAVPTIRQCFGLGMAASGIWLLVRA